MMRLKIKIVALFISFALHLQAQDFPYHYFTHVIPEINNPSLAAASSDMNVAFGGYNLWAGGYKPVSNYLVSLSFSPDFRKRRNYNRNATRVGVGVNLLKERTGPFNQHILHLMYAYHIPVSGDAQLSLGISGIAENLFIDINSLSPGQPDDPRLTGGNNQSFLLDGGFGASIISEKFQISFSALNLAPGTYRLSEQNAQEITSYRKFFLNSMYLIHFSPNFFIRPQVTLRNSRLNLLNYDASFDLGLHYFDVGAGYRSESSLFAFIRVPLAGFTFSWTSENPLQASHMAGYGHSITVGWSPGL